MKLSAWTGLKGWKRFVLVYTALLILSHLVIWLFDSPIEVENGADGEVELQTVLENAEQTGQKITISYRDVYHGEEPNPETILLLPGGPEGPEVFEELIPELSSQFRVILPHLPGYGNPQKDLPDYSFQALAEYTEQLITKLDIKQVHLVGYGLGGASAIYLSHKAPNKIQSLSLTSSIGVQELELLGSYTLNHAVHGVLLGAVWLLHNAIPHFGLFDALDIDVPYAKSYYESDQRPLRSYLKEYQKPMLILHGEEDPIVPLAVAQEHYRIVPQSILKIFQADHDMVETHSDLVGQALSQFVSDVSRQTAPTASDASQERVAEAQKPFSNVEFAKFKGVTLLIIMLLIIFSTWISEDLTCIGAGLMAARGLIGFWPATLACFIGIFIGDIGLYLIGRVLGRSAIRKAPLKWIISENDLDRSAKWFQVRGPAIIIASRFLPGSRLPTYFSAGVIGAGFWMFTSYFLLAAIIWTPILVGISQLLGNELLRYFSLYQDYAIWVFLGAVVFLVVIAKIIIPAFSYRGRRMLVSRYRRVTRWEYWAPFILYTPVFFYVIYLGLKNRCLTLFTAVNPAIPDSGFVGESKSNILDLFNEKVLARYNFISSDLDYEAKLEQAKAFMDREKLSFPVVLKPDVGERGKGVAIIHKMGEMQNYLKEMSGDIILQEYLQGEEYGVFYYRMPDDQKGDIFSITTKKLLSVRGDGSRTLEELILDDNQTVNLAKYHLRKKEGQLYEVPDDGEVIPIVELGTHARGAVFGDGRDLITEELIERMNEICDPVSGFYFGRFDLKAPSDDILKTGKDIKIIEVNGVTSESTNIYDSEYSLLDAVKILSKQWKLAFEIGKQNRENGFEPTPFWPFLKSLFQSLK